MDPKSGSLFSLIELFLPSLHASCAQDQGIIVSLMNEENCEVTTGLRSPQCQVKVFAKTLALFDETKLRPAIEYFLNLFGGHLMFDSDLVYDYIQPDNLANSHLTVILHVLRTAGHPKAFTLFFLTA